MYYFHCIAEESKWLGFSCFFITDLNNRPYLSVYHSQITNWSNLFEHNSHLLISKERLFRTQSQQPCSRCRQASPEFLLTDHVQVESARDRCPTSGPSHITVWVEGLWEGTRGPCPESQGQREEEEGGSFLDSGLRLGPLAPSVFLEHV